MRRRHAVTSSTGPRTGPPWRGRSRLSCWAAGSLSFAVMRCNLRRAPNYPGTITRSSMTGQSLSARSVHAMVTVHNFSYGLLTPGLAYLMSVTGSFLGLCCTSRSRASTGRARVRWLLVGGGSIGITGIWVMHFIAMLGFTIPTETIHYNVPVTLLSMLIAVAFVSIGLLIVGLSETMTFRSLLLGGVVTGLGVAAMHYSGMAAMRMAG